MGALMMDVPCGECKRLRHTGERCRKRLRHNAPNWDYKHTSNDVAYVSGRDPAEEAAAFEEFQRRRRESADRAALEMEAKRRVELQECVVSIFMMESRHEKQLRSLEEIRKKQIQAGLNPATAGPSAVRFRRRWSEEEHAGCMEGVRKFGTLSCLGLL